MATFGKHDEWTAEVSAPAETLFDYLNDHTRLAGHMSKSSWMMMGSHMDIAVDENRGRKVGSVIRLSGKVLGLSLDVEEAVTELVPGRRKVWETIGEPRLLVVGPYRMGFEIGPQEQSSRLRVFLDYELPKAGLERAIGAMLGAVYARWCTRQMAEDARAHFAGLARP